MNDVSKITSSILKSTSSLTSDSIQKSDVSIKRNNKLANISRNTVEEVNLEDLPTSSNSNDVNNDGIVDAQDALQLLKQGKTDEANAVLREAAKINSSSSNDVNNDGVIDAQDALQLLKQGKTDEANAVLNEAAKINSSNNEASINVFDDINTDIKVDSSAIQDMANGVSESNINVSSINNNLLNDSSYANRIINSTKNNNVNVDVSAIETNIQVDSSIIKNF